MTNQHDIEERIARYGGYASAFVAGGLACRSVAVYNYAMELPPSKEAGNAALTSYLELTGALFLVGLSYALFRSAKESRKFSLEQDASQKIR